MMNVNEYTGIAAVIMVESNRVKVKYYFAVFMSKLAKNNLSVHSRLPFALLAACRHHPCVLSTYRASKRLFLLLGEYWAGQESKTIPTVLDRISPRSNEVVVASSFISFKIFRTCSQKKPPPSHSKRRGCKK